MVVAAVAARWADCPVCKLGCCTKEEEVEAGVGVGPEWVRKVPEADTKRYCAALFAAVVFLETLHMRLAFEIDQS